jgi:hypothetical protein
MEEYSKGKRRMAANCQGDQGPAWAVELQISMIIVVKSYLRVKVR